MRDSRRQSSARRTYDADGLILSSHRRPRTRGDCEGGVRPCPWVSCKYHLWHDRQDDDVFSLPETCALDVGQHGPHSRDEIGALLGLSRERIRQYEVAAVEKLRVKGINLKESWEDTEPCEIQYEKEEDGEVLEIPDPECWLQELSLEQKSEQPSYF